MIYIIIALFIVFTAIREYFFYVERSQLLNRIMAKDLKEYQAIEDKTKAKDVGKINDDKRVKEIEFL